MDNADRKILTTLTHRVIAEGARPDDVDKVAAGLLFVLLSIDETLDAIDRTVDGRLAAIEERLRDLVLAVGVRER